jgi:NADH-quinone oxidoreductase subunit N
MSPNAASLNFRDFYVLAPEMALAVWGLLVLMVDVGLLRGKPNARRRMTVGWLSLAGVVVSLVVAMLPLLGRYNIGGIASHLPSIGTDSSVLADPYLFFGTLSGDLLNELFNPLYIVLLGLVVGMSMSWSFTDDWGEYFALLFWSTVGMMLLTAAEELLTLFLTLETMTICLYLCTAFEKSKRRSAEGGLKYFVYGSVSSALFLFGLSLIYGLTGSTQFSAIRQALYPESGGDMTGLSGNIPAATAVLLMLVGFGFKVAAVPFHQWAPDAYEGAPAPVTAWVATGSKMASFVALMKVLLNALGPWESRVDSVSSPGWIGLVVVLSAASMTYGNFAALAQRNFKRMLAYSSIAHAGYLLVGVAAAGVSNRHEESAGSVLFYLVTYAFSNIGAFAVAAWLARDKGSDDIDDLNGMGRQHPGLAICLALLMLSLIGMPPLAGFFGKLYMFMEALNETRTGRLTFLWLVGLGLLNSVVSAFYYVRVLKAIFLRDPIRGGLGPAPTSIALPIVLATAVVVGFGIFPTPLLNDLKDAAIPMLRSSNVLGHGTAPGTSHAEDDPNSDETPSPARAAKPSGPTVTSSPDGSETNPPAPSPVSRPRPRS